MMKLTSTWVEMTTAMMLQLPMKHMGLESKRMGKTEYFFDFRIGYIYTIQQMVGAQELWSCSHTINFPGQ